MTPRNFRILQAVALALFGVVMFNLLYRMLVVTVPGPFLGMLMVTAAFMIAFGSAYAMGLYARKV